MGQLQRVQPLLLAGGEIAWAQAQIRQAPVFLFGKLQRQPPPAALAQPHPAAIGGEQRLQLSQLGRAEPAARPAGPLDASAGRPPATSSRCHRLADIRVTRKCSATSRSVAPSSNHSAAANRTRSRRARSSAVSPPPSGYLMPLA